MNNAFTVLCLIMENLEFILIKLNYINVKYMRTLIENNIWFTWTTQPCEIPFGIVTYT